MGQVQKIKSTKKKTSFKLAFHFIQNAQNFLQFDNGDTKLNYAINKVLKRLESIPTQWNEKKADISLDHAAVDEKGCVIFTINPQTQSRDYSFTKEGLKASDKALTDAFAKEGEVEFEPYMATELPTTLTEDFVGVFDGFVLNKEEALKQLAELKEAATVTVE